MPLTLPELQRAFAGHLVGADRAELLAHVVGDRIPAEARLAVYRHHVQHSLAAALATTFSTVQAVVGEEFFRQLARAFVRQCLPTQPVLAEYGAGLADFIASYGPASDLPYLADVARLDWALNVAYQASRVEGLGPSDLAVIEADRLPSMSLSLAPGTTLVTSRYPLGRIWLASQPGAEGGSIDLHSGDARLLVIRRTDDAAFVELAAGEAAFVAELLAGRSIERAAEAAFQVDGAFDLSVAFARLLGLRVADAVQ
ncbi:MAG: putative DNA-binding domain-containing protein [Reyranella sp.]|uniref:HvfC/BufC family peptide modification chaperone n=1 Tax=Reyranella sp. TaxID=1929291 RepID=UPI003D14A39B